MGVATCLTIFQKWMDVCVMWQSTCGAMSLDIGDVKKQLKHMKAWGGLMTANAAPMTLGYGTQSLCSCSGCVYGV
jgi:hypothetical protein